MATFRLSVQILTRAKSANCIKAASYRSGERLTESRTGEVHDYTRRGQVIDKAILVPEDAPQWATDREALWNAVEVAEKRKDSQVAREVQVSLPHELSLDENRRLLHEFVREQFVAHGMVADVVIHGAHPGGDDRNIHSHVMLTTRAISSDGFGSKVTAWNSKDLLKQWRAEWERHVNLALERGGRSERIDHRSYAAQGVDREPEPKQGRVATRIERQGRRSRAGDDRRAAKQRNARRERLAQAKRILDDRILAEARVASTNSRDEVGEALAIRPATAPHWLRFREDVLSDKYLFNLQGHRLARFYRISRAGDGLKFENARSMFVDRGAEITTSVGSDMDIRGMLDLARIKGWYELVVWGSNEFQRRAVEAALAQGFRVSGHDVERAARIETRRDASRVNERTQEVGWAR
jgi:hypothetical protein